MVKDALNKMDKENYVVMAGVITRLLDYTEGGAGDETPD